MYKSPLSKTAQSRLQVLRDSNDGLVIAQRNLEISGPGELLGTRQTGNAEFRVVDLLRDQAMIPEVQRLAWHIHQHHPDSAHTLIERWMPERVRYTFARARAASVAAILSRRAAMTRLRDAATFARVFRRSTS